VELYAVKEEKFTLLRHDVEFSLQRALKLAEWDNQLQFPSSTLIQVYCDAYNIFSRSNKKVIVSIDELPYSTIGLHLYVSHLKEGDWDGFYLELERQSKLLSECISRKVDRFSIHRPPKWILERRCDVISGMLNFYGDSFFEFNLSPQKIKYFADSQHDFKYGSPLQNHSFSKVQLLFHPDEWSEKGCDTGENFLELSSEHMQKFKQCLLHETNHYKAYQK
jgi:hypothetical protein